jgi:hypothetical protein
MTVIGNRTVKMNGNDVCTFRWESSLVELYERAIIYNFDFLRDPGA